MDKTKTPIQIIKSESCFNEASLRKAYIDKYDSMTEEEKVKVMITAQSMINEVKRRNKKASFGIDSALQVMYVLGTFLNEKKLERRSGT